MTNFYFAVKVHSKSLGEIDAGGFMLASTGYEDLTDNDGAKVAAGEISAFPESGMMQYKGVVLPREDWGGLTVTLQSKWVHSDSAASD